MDLNFVVRDCRRVLCVAAFQRFEFSMETYSFDKVNSRFEFPEELDMAPYMLAPSTVPAPTAPSSAGAPVSSEVCRLPFQPE